LHGQESKSNAENPMAAVKGPLADVRRLQKTKITAVGQDSDHPLRRKETRVRHTVYTADLWLSIHNYLHACSILQYLSINLYFYKGLLKLTFYSKISRLDRETRIDYIVRFPWEIVYKN
jgi:hypothetical protein